MDLNSTFCWFLEWILTLELGSWTGVLLNASADSLDYPITQSARNGKLEIVDSYMLEHFVRMQETAFDNYVPLVGVGRALAGLFALIYLFWRVYNLSLKAEQEWEILPLMRPVGILLVLSYWPAFAEGCYVPGKYLGNYARINYWNKIHDVDSLYRRRVHLMDSLGRVVSVDFAEAQMIETMNKDEESSNDFISSVTGFFSGDAVNDGLEEIFNTGARKVTGLQNMFLYIFKQGVGILGQLVFNIAIGLVLLIQLILTVVLYVTGPISMAFSLLPGFSNSFSYWLRQFIGVSLYTCVCYLIIFMGISFLEYAVFKEVRFLESIIGNTGAILLWICGTQSTHAMGIIFIYVFTAVAIFTTPILATYTVASAGGGAVMFGSALISKAASASKSVFKMAKALMGGR